MKTSHFVIEMKHSSFQRRKVNAIVFYHDYKREWHPAAQEKLVQTTQYDENHVNMLKDFFLEMLFLLHPFNAFEEVYSAYI